MAAHPLPLDPSEITSDWLTAALSARAAGTVVTRVEIDAVAAGTATKVMVRATYANGPEPGGPPEALCIKGGFDPALRPLVAFGYHTEAKFYSEIAPGLQVPLPNCWFTSSEPERDQAIVILDDLRRGGGFGRPTRPFTPDQVAAGLEHQAIWHAATWDRAGVDLPWLTVGSPVQRGVIRLWVEEDYWKHKMDGPQAATVPGVLRDRARVAAAFECLWEIDDASLLCLSHGDAHIGNTYLDDRGRPSFIDWQTTCLAPWSDDLAYFIVGALSVEDRRAHERDLLERYLRALERHGAPSPDFETAWRDYRRHQLHGFAWALVPEEMQPPEFAGPMVERYATAAVDHDTLGALGA